MNQLNRGNAPLPIRIFRALKSFLKLMRSVIIREITMKQFILDIKFRFIAQSRILNDDFDWEKYPNYYKEELKSISRLHTLIIRDENFRLHKGKLVKRDSEVKDLHPNHHVLYRAVLNLHPTTVLEVGCGGGDHLSNIKELSPGIKLYGVDRSPSQLKTFEDRHPDLSKIASVVDITERDCKLQKVDLIFTQAVLMHISEKDERFHNALENIFESAENFVVLVENWTQHNFLDEIRKIQSNNSGWKNSYLYFIQSDYNEFSSALIISKSELPDMDKLTSYEQLLAGRKVLVH